jgi:hypothetical protein
MKRLGAFDPSMRREKKCRFKYFLFKSSEELLGKFDENKFLADLYFIDYYMKVQNVVETALHIRQYDTQSDIVFVIGCIRKP